MCLTACGTEKVRSHLRSPAVHVKTLCRSTTGPDLSQTFHRLTPVIHRADPALVKQEPGAHPTRPR
ncbi:hypothetical protein NOCARDAX2BIS_240050 [Nocardioides sp. AX2bis]|nr:hypothetical protein NOCARDAX2BIS_240050 [Nocardioides sp. AX2bis]